MSIISLWLCYFFQGCSDKPEDPCGCKAGRNESVSDTYSSVFIHEGRQVLITLDKGYVVLCDNTIVFEGGQVLHQVNGVVKSVCTLALDTTYAYSDVYIYKAHYFELISSISYNQPLLNTPIARKHFVIEVFKSEDFGYPEGFGYKISNTQTGFNLFQPTPPVQGWVPCKTENDAIRTAFLHTSKMYLENQGLVTVPAEIHFSGFKSQRKRGNPAITKRI